MPPLITRPDNRSGWLEGETPRTPVDEVKKRTVPPRPEIVQVEARK